MDEYSKISMIKILLGEQNDSLVAPLVKSLTAMQETWV